jgi:hypothetical protein
VHFTSVLNLNDTSDALKIDRKTYLIKAASVKYEDAYIHLDFTSLHNIKTQIQPQSTFKLWVR